MRKLFSLLVMSALLVASLQVVNAADEKPKKGGGDGAAQVLSLPKGIELTADQETKIKEIRKSFAEKAKAAQAKVDAVLTGDLKKKAQEARKSAMESGKKGKDVEAAVNEALGLSADQQAALKEANKGVAEVKAAFIKEASSVLTEEQKAKLPKAPAAGEPKKKKAA